MSQPVAIEVNDLRKVYKSGMFGRVKLAALKGVSFNVNQGEIFGLLGPNGAGKTTFLKILMGIIGKSGGRASMMGYAAGSRAGRQMVGYLPEHLRIPQHMSGFTALECYGNLSNVPSSVIRTKRTELLRMVGLEGRGKDQVKKYSKGMLQRLGLAQALLHDPQLLVLDEPTDGLDPRARAEMRQIIRNLKDKGVTIFLNSHILQEVEMVCERVAILHKGELKYSGPVSEIGNFVGNLFGTGVTGPIIEIEIVGDPDLVNQCFQEIDFNVKSAAENRFVVQATLPNQEGVDQLIDRLRSNKVSLISLNRDQVSLEDAFLQIVDDQNAQQAT